MKIICFANSARSFINFRLNLIKRLKYNFKDVTIICPLDSESLILKNLNFNVINLNINSHGKNPLKEIILFFKIFKIYKKLNPDLALHFTIKPNLYGSIICRILKIKTINNITGLGETFIKEGFFLKLIIYLYKFSFKSVDHVFFQNNYDYKIFEKLNIFKNSYSILPGSGVNINKYITDYYPNSSIINFLFIGRIVKEKGIEELLLAAEQIKNINNKVNFNFIGEKHSKLSISLNKKFDNAIKNNIINYSGYQNNIEKYVINANAIILPSYREGLSHSLLVAGSMSRPLLVSNVPGCIDLVQNNVNGLIFEPKDVNSLILAIKRFTLFSNFQMKEMGLKSKEIIHKNFDENIVINEYENFIKNIYTE